MELSAESRFVNSVWKETAHQFIVRTLKAALMTMMLYDDPSCAQIAKAAMLVEEKAEEWTRNNGKIDAEDYEEKLHDMLDMQQRLLTSVLVAITRMVTFVAKGSCKVHPDNFNGSFASWRFHIFGATGQLALPAQTN